MSIDQLSRILRLSHAGTVRLVDRLIERSLVEKQPSVLERKIMSLALTTDGRQQRDKLLALRSAGLTFLLNQVEPEDLTALERAAGIVAAASAEAVLKTEGERQCRATDAAEQAPCSPDAALQRLCGYIPPGSYLANRCLTEREKRD